MIKNYRLEELLKNPQKFSEFFENERIFCYPTDTIYGLGAKVTENTVKKIYEIKQRPTNKPLSLLAPSHQRIDQHTLTQDSSNFLRKKFQQVFPNRGLTLLLPFDPDSDFSFSLLTDSNKIGLRIINHPIQSLIATTGQPIITTSANISGNPPLKTTKNIQDALPAFEGVAIEGGKIVQTTPSVVIDVENNEIIRQ